MKRITTVAVAGAALAGVVGVSAVAAAPNGPGGLIGDVLSGLVSKGTITQQQADAVEEALGDARAERRADREERWADREGHGADHEGRGADRRAELDALLTDVLGMTAAEVREELAAGRTLKEIAGDRADELADAFVAQVEEHTQEAVEAGRLTQERADEAVARARERAEAWLAGESDSLGRGLLGGGRGPGGHGGPRGHGMGPGGPGGPGELPEPSASTAAWRI